MGARKSKLAASFKFRKDAYGASIGEDDTPEVSLPDIIVLQSEFDRKLSLPIAVQVAHLTPSIFPLCPQINRSVFDLCESSWLLINAVDCDGVCGLTKFYSSFYDHLESLDTNGRFISVLTQNVGSSDDVVAAKGAIVIRIVNYMLSIKSKGKRDKMSLQMLGKAHSLRGIRPWQYSMFLEVMLHTIAERLGREATHDTMRAWVNLSAYVLQGMLPQAIRGQVVETECAVNTSCEFYSGEIEDQLEVLQESRSTSRSASAGSTFGATRKFSNVNTPGGRSSGIRSLR